MAKLPPKIENAVARFKKRKWLYSILFLLVVGSVTIGILSSRSLDRLDERIQAVFDGPKWSIPARVYARPLELYVGLSIDTALVVDELTRLGYTRGIVETERPGRFTEGTQRIEVHTRGFRFADGFEPARILTIVWQGASISELYDHNNQPIAITRLEPQLIGRISPVVTEDRLLVNLEQLPDGLINTLLAVEDPKFYKHNGVSPKGIARAMWVNLKERRFAQGGSTITQQLVKNLFLTRERSIKRKLTEWPMAITLERRYSKDEILQAFINEVFFAQDNSRAVHGFGLASQYLFSKPVQELDTHEYALLVAMLKGPSLYDPIRNPDTSKDRRDLVLKIMLRDGLLSEEDFQRYQLLPLGVAKRPGIQQPAYLDLVKQQLTNNYSTEDLHKNGLKVFTNFDPLVQQQLEESVESAIQRITFEQSLEQEEVDSLQIASVVSRADNGEVLAILGGRQARYAGFNRALDAKRPIGSLIKPFIYAAALEEPERFNLATLIDDMPLTLTLANGDTWSPDNFTETSRGPVLLLDGLTHSLNQATVDLGLKIGLERVVESLESYDPARDIQPLPSLLLGALELSTIDVASLYQSLAASGFNTPLRAIREVQASDGQLLQRFPLKLQQQLDDATMHQLNYALQNIMRAGTGRRAYRYLPADIAIAGKSGTSNQNRDSWFAGYDAAHNVVVWMGNDDNSPTRLTGSRGALELWSEIFMKLGPQSLNFYQPRSVSSIVLQRFHCLFIQGTNRK